MSKGTFVWFELVTPEPEVAARFYTELLGLEVQEQDLGGNTYRSLAAGGQGIGGIVSQPEAARTAGEPPRWLGYVEVEDVDAAAGRLTEGGGSVLLAPMDLPGTGRIATVADPQGAVFALYASARDGASSGEPSTAPGTISWVELISSDHEAGLGFYGELLGWRRTEQMDMGEGSVYQLFGLDQTMGGAFTPKEPMPTGWLYYFRVPDIDAAIARATELGGALISGPQEVPGGEKVAQLQDPQGGMFAIHALA